MEKYNFRKPSSYFLPIRLVTMPRLTVAVVMGLARDVASLATMSACKMPHTVIRQFFSKNLLKVDYCESGKMDRHSMFIIIGGREWGVNILKVHK